MHINRNDFFVNMISVIIPANNAEATIHRAILSATGNIPDGEIIVVENGCTDNTEEIVKAAALNDERIKLIHSEKGVSAARNAGLKAASGDWIMFLDADDCFLPGAKKIISACVNDKETDFWLFGHMAGKEKRGVNKTNADKRYSGFQTEQIRVKMIENPTRYMQVWGKLFKADVVKDNGLFFNEAMALSEDSDFTLRYTGYCRSICLSPHIIYSYSIDPGSTIRKNDGEKIKKYVHAMEETGKGMDGESPAIRGAFRKYILMHMNIAIVRGALSYSDDSATDKDRIERMKATAAEDIFATAIKSTKASECFSLRMLPVFFLKKHLYRLAYLVYNARAKQNARRETR